MRNTKRPRLFNKLFELLPGSIINNAVKQFQGDRYRKRHTVVEFIRLNILSMTSGAYSLRETLDRIKQDKSWARLVNHVEAPISRAQTYKMNNKLDPDMFAHIFRQFSAQLRSRHGPKLNKVYALDSTFIQSRSKQCRLVKRGHKSGSHNKVSGVKAHIVMDITNRLPAKIAVTEGNIHDVGLLHFLDALGKTVIRVFDKGYRHYKTFKRYVEHDKWFITPRISAGKMQITETYVIKDSDIKAGVLADAKGQLGVDREYRDTYIRYVTVQPKDTRQKPYVLMTNLFDVSAARVCETYRQRSKIEVDIRTLKQLFRANKLTSYKDSGIVVQWFLTLIAYMLVWLFEKNNVGHWTVWKMATYLRDKLEDTWDSIKLPVPT